MYTNSFSISYYGKGNDYQTWDYYYNYYDYRNARNDNVAPGDASGNSYIQFGPKCENTVKALKKMGVSVTPGICIIMMSLKIRKTGVTE